MENDMLKLNLFNRSEIFNENSSLSINYQSLPFIMSALNMDTSSGSPSNLFQNSFTAGAGVATTSKYDKPSPSSSFSEDDNEKLVESETNFEGRATRRRSSRECNSLLRINRRIIKKPKKLVKEINLTPAAIRKLYIDSSKKVGRFRPSNLETIFEEPSEVEEASDQIKFLGNKKLKRSLSCSDGLNITKATIKNRRQKIKKIFGKRFALKKISLCDLHEKLNSSMEDSSIIEEELEKNETTTDNLVDSSNNCVTENM